MTCSKEGKEMFLIDSSAWIEFLRPSGSKKIKERVRNILSKGEVASCGVVKIEILRGAKNKSDFEKLNDLLLSVYHIPVDDEVIFRASLWGFELDRKGKVVSTTDLIIASAAFKKATLVHIDKDFEVIATLFDLDQEKLPR